MSPRDTGSGRILEQLVLPALKGNQYDYEAQKIIGPSVSGGLHRIDVLVKTKENGEIPVSLKWQQSSGSAEEKVPYEIIKLIHAINTSEGRFKYAYLVLAGMGWKKKEFYLGNVLSQYIIGYDLVRIVSLEKFITEANLRHL